MKESPIFARTYDFVQWLIPRTMDFPRSQRFVLTKRLQDAALNFQECLLEAGLSAGPQRVAKLQTADAELAKVRFYLRLAHDLTWLRPGQYQHAARWWPKSDDCWAAGANLLCSPQPVDG